MELLSGVVSQVMVKGQFAVLVYFLGVNSWYMILLADDLDTGSRLQRRSLD